MTLLQVRAATVSLQKGLSPAERAANLLLTLDRRPLPKLLVLVDDVVTSGAHFKAAGIALRSICTDRRIIGLFLARTRRHDPRHTEVACAAAT